MAISYENKCIFVHIPRTGGTSLDASNLFVTSGNTPQPSEKLKIYKHSTATEIKNAIGQELWNDSFKFAFVRNPWDLMVSCYHWWFQISSSQKGLKNDIYIKEMSKVMNMSFSEFILSEHGRNYIIVFKGNYFDWISDENGNILVDFIGRFERLYEDYETIFKKVGMHYSLPPHRKKSIHKHYSRYYTNETRDVIAERFKKEIEMFNYSFDRVGRFFTAVDTSRFACEQTYSIAKSSIRSTIKSFFPSFYNLLKKLKNRFSS